MTDPRTVDGDTYEMFWDCKYCRTTKLLGLTHRHCPVCGAPQNAAERYFPSEAEQVRVADHQYVGRDLVCKHCGTYNSRNSQHCRDCGAPTAEGKDAPVLADQPQEPVKAQALSANASKPKSRRGLIIKAVILALLGFVALLVFWKKEEAFVVTAQSWERKIDIERFGPTRESTWCDQLPLNARELRRSRAVRSHEQIPDGETCTTRRVDQGDGTFRQVNDCKPRYKTRDIFDDRCEYEVNRWVMGRSVQTSGSSNSPPPSWPAMPAIGGCVNVGCERAGAKRETYRVEVRAPDGTSEVCEVDSGRWARMGVGQRCRAKVRVVAGGVDCASLTVE